MTLQLTARQSNILDFIRDRLDHTGQAPTLEEIGLAMGLANVSAVLKHVRSLEAKGRLLIEPNRSRGIRLVTSHDPMDADTMELPLVGRIAAGEPLFSDARVERTLRVSSWLFRLKPDYLVRVVAIRCATRASSIRTSWACTPRRWRAMARWWLQGWAATASPSSGCTGRGM